MALIPYALVAGVLLLYPQAGTWNAMWAYRWTGLLLGLVLMTGWSFKKHSIPLALLLTYLIGTSAIRSFSPELWPNSIEALQLGVGATSKLHQALRMSAALTTLTLLIVSGAMMALPRWRASLLPPLKLAAGLVTLAVLLSRPWVEITYFIHNPSMAGSFIAVCLPLFRSWVWVGLGLVACLCTGATVPVLAAAVGLVARGRGWRFLVLATALVTVAVAWIGPSTFLSGTGRYGVWAIVVRWFTNQDLVTQLFGTGAGSSLVLVPTLQALTGTPMDSWWFFPFMHNDWLQIFFEWGAVGLFLAVAVYCEMLCRSFSSPRLLGAVLAYGVTMLANFPLHFPLHALLGAALVREVYIRRIHAHHVW